MRFVDDNGAFTPVGPDMNGQRVRLRSQPTSAGLAKLKFHGCASVPTIQTPMPNGRLRSPPHPMSDRAAQGN